MLKLEYRLLHPGEETDACNLVNRVFNQFIATYYTTQGMQEFQKYANPAAMRQRLLDGNLVLVAAALHEIVGVIEMRGHSHVSLLFVDQAYQGQGISKELLHRALTICRQHHPLLTEVTVNASPNAVPVYERLGFVATDVQQEKNGILFTPMILKLRPDELALA